MLVKYFAFKLLGEDVQFTQYEEGAPPISSKVECSNHALVQLLIYLPLQCILSFFNSSPALLSIPLLTSAVYAHFMDQCLYPPTVGRKPSCSTFTRRYPLFSLPVDLNWTALKGKSFRHRTPASFAHIMNSSSGTCLILGNLITDDTPIQDAPNALARRLQNM